jgi:hypothetical protein
VTFLVLLLPFCWAIDAVYDAPVRRRLLAFRPPRIRPRRQGRPRRLTAPPAAGGAEIGVDGQA